MPDNDDLRMNQNETLNCKLALMGVWTEACREAAAYFGVNPDGSGNFSSVTQAQAGSTAGTLAVDGISADEMTSRLAASLVEHFPDKTDIITGDPAAAKAYVKQYVVDLANHQALAQARTNSKLFHKQLNRAAVGLADEHGPYTPVPAAEEEFDMCVPLMDGTIEENSEEVAEFSRELDRTGIRYKFSELAAAGSAKVQTCLEFMSRDIKAVQAACTRAAQNISARGRAFADKVKCVPFVLSAAAQGISDAVRDAAELMDKGYEEIKAAAAKDPRSVAAAAKHCADATANVPTRHLRDVRSAIARGVNQVTAAHIAGGRRQRKARVVARARDFNRLHGCGAHKRHPVGHGVLQCGDGNFKRVDKPSRGTPQRARCIGTGARL